MADDVGSLLLRAGLVAPDQLAAARQEVENVGGTVPEQLVQQGHIGDEELTAFYRNRLLIPRVNPSDLAKLSGRLLEKVPPDMATEFRSIPVSLDAEGNLTLVMSDPSDTEAVDEIGFFTGSYVVRAIATQAQIAWCLAHYYKQKTPLYLGLVADGQWPDTQEEEASPVIPEDPHEAETAPIPTRKPGEKAKARKRAGRADTEEAPDFQTTPTQIRKLERPSNQQPSPPELAARAGEIRAAAAPVADRRVDDEGPAVVISIDPELEKEAAGVVKQKRDVSDTAPILLTAIRKKSEEAETGPILLKKKRSKRRSSKPTNIGLGAVGSDQSAPTEVAASAEAKAESKPAAKGKKSKSKSKKAKAKQSPAQMKARSVDLVGGDWGAPGTTIPPGYLGAFSESFEDAKLEEAAVPVAIEEDSTSQIRAPDTSTPIKVEADEDATVKSDAPAEVKRVTAADAATKLLLAVRNIDKADDRTKVVEPILSFFDLSYERTGFMALKQDDLVTWRLHGCPDGAKSTIDLTADSTFKDVVRMRLPYNGPLVDSFTKQLARDLDIPDAMDLLLLPVVLRERVLGVFIAIGSFGSIYEEHISVLSQAAAEAFERIVLARKK
jgi:hypothetical protein